MFSFYYIWGFFLYFIIFFKNPIERLYIKFNKNILSRKRDFNDAGYFEKLFLTLFFRKNIFKNSIANLYTNENLFLYRSRKYPLIFFFHLYFDRMVYKFARINLLKKYFYYFSKSSMFTKVFIKISPLFFKKIKKKFLIFLILQKIFFKRYYNLCSSLYYVTYKENNQVKLNWLFFLFLYNSKGKLVLHDLSKYNEWYFFNFKFDTHHEMYRLKKPKKKNKKKIFFEISLQKFKKNRKSYFKKIYYIYNVFYKSVHLNITTSFKSIFFVNFKNFKNAFIKIDQNWSKSLELFYPIRYNETSITKFIDLNNINSYNFYYIRKNRIFNKGRYSRNRQLYRTGVYWCLWLNIILVYGLYFLFYRFTFNFGYFWWGILFLMYSTIFSRVIKYNFFNIFYINNELFNFIKWCGLIFNDTKMNFLGLFKKIIFLNYIYIYFKNINYFFLSHYFNFLILKFFNFIKLKRSGKYIYFWEGLKKGDDSLLRYKTLFHWFSQIYKLLTF